MCMKARFFKTETMEKTEKMDIKKSEDDGNPALHGTAAGGSMLEDSMPGSVFEIKSFSEIGGSLTPTQPVARLSEMKKEPSSPRPPRISNLKMIAKRKERRQTVNEVTYFLEDLALQQLIEEPNIPHPERALPMRDLPQGVDEENLNKLDINQMLCEPLGRFFLNETIKMHRATNFHAVGKEVVERMGPAYDTDAHEHIHIEDQVREAGILLAFLEAVFDLIRSKPSGTITAAEANILKESYGIDIDFDLGPERSSKEEYSERVGSTAPDERTQNLILTKANINAAIQAQQAARVSNPIGSPNVAPNGGLMARMKSIKDFRRASNLQDTSFRNMNIPMDLQKSLADSNFSMGSSEFFDAGSMNAFQSKINEDGSVGMMLDMKANLQDKTVLFIIEDISIALELVFEKFKQDKNLRSRYFQLREWSMTPIGEADIRRLRVLGHGSFGEVSAVMLSNIGFLLAQKSFSKSRLKEHNERGVFIAEVNCLRRLTLKPSPFCLHLVAAYETSTSYHLVLPCALGGDLNFLLKKHGPLEFDHARFYACEIAMAIGHLHKLGFLYRDLKPANVLLSATGHCLLSDFGLAIYVGDSEGKTSGKCGTPGYYSIEVLENQPYSIDVDWWGFGCVLFELLHGVSPFDPKVTLYSTRDEGLRKVRSITFPHNFPPQAQPLIRSLLNRTVKERCGCMGMDVEEVFAVKSFWDGWKYDIDAFKVRGDQLPEAYYIPEQKINAPEQEIAHMNIREKGANGRNSNSQQEISFQPFVNVDQFQRDIVRVLEYQRMMNGERSLQSSVVSLGETSVFAEEFGEGPGRMSAASTRTKPGSFASIWSRNGARTSQASNGTRNSRASPHNIRASPRNSRASPRNSQASPRNSRASPRNSRASPRNSRASPRNGDGQLLQSHHENPKGCVIS